MAEQPIDVEAGTVQKEPPAERLRRILGLGESITVQGRVKGRPAGPVREVFIPDKRIRLDQVLTIAADRLELNEQHQQSGKLAEG